MRWGAGRFRFRWERVTWCGGAGSRGPAGPRFFSIARMRAQSPALPVLYSFRRCPYAMRARFALMTSGQCCELREVVLRDKPAELLAASPKGTVPVLVDTDGTVIEQSLDIMLW